MPSLADYEGLLAPARDRFAESPAIKALESLRDDVFCELFLMYFCALGVQMTKPVEDWIRRAGNRCADMGFSDVGRALTFHASAEADHHLALIADLRSLAARWNARRAPPIDADAFLVQAPSPDVVAYCRLHEENIASTTPFAQVAIEYEIEQLPLRYGSSIAARCVELLGLDIVSCLGFITQHMLLDAGHTEFNAQTLDGLIERAPWSLSPLVAAGSSALNVYAGFLGDCMQRAEDHVRRVRNRGARPQPSMTWQINTPLENLAHAIDHSSEWLGNVRSLRGKVLFDNGRRPLFMASDGTFQDADPIDTHSFHILAYDGTTLVGCARVYHLRPGGPPCLTERILGEATFSEVLRTLHAGRTEIVEIGRWVVDADYRTKNLGLGIQLAAASGAFARWVGTASGCASGFVICAAGTKNRQDAMLARVGLVPIPGIEPVACADYGDDIRILCCSQTQRLHAHLEGSMDEMAEKLGLYEATRRPDPSERTKVRG